ncbi:MAG: hypothetical protein V3V76_03020, partial [Candidatus Adiutricales bacterium]
MAEQTETTRNKTRPGVTPAGQEDVMKREPRDYSIFDAELSGQVFNMRLLIRLLGWLKPYRLIVLSGLGLILLAAFLAVLNPVVISL